MRVLNTNVDGKQKIMFALTSIKGIGRRFANLICKKADVDMNKRLDLYWFFSQATIFYRKKDYKDGLYLIVSLSFWIGVNACLFVYWALPLISSLSI